MFDLFLILFDLGLFALYGLIGFTIFMIIQLISYRIFHKNPYKWIMKKLEMY